MKKLLLLTVISTLFLTGCIIAIDGHDYQRNDLKETKKQLLLDDAQEIKNFEIRAGRGSLKIIGDNDVSQITVDSAIGSKNGNDYKF